jgi:hypothetical protein
LVKAALKTSGPDQRLSVPRDPDPPKIGKVALAQGKRAASLGEMTTYSWSKRSRTVRGSGPVGAAVAGRGTIAR